MSFFAFNRGSLNTPTVYRGDLSNNASYLGNNNGFNRSAIEAANRAEGAANRVSVDAGLDKAADRALQSARQISQLGEQNRNADFNRSQTINREDRDFKSSESAKDRAKSSDEYTQNRYQQNFQSAQNRSDLEYTTRARQEDQRQDRENGLHTQARAIGAAAQLNQANILRDTKLANISQQTSLAEQKTSLDRAKEAAKAQVTSALYGSSRQYAGY